jgi:hypothetical protein
MFTKEEVFAFPSVSLDYKAGLIPLWRRIKYIPTIESY